MYNTWQALIQCPTNGEPQLWSRLDPWLARRACLVMEELSGRAGSSRRCTRVTVPAKIVVEKIWGSDSPGPLQQLSLPRRAFSLTDDKGTFRRMNAPSLRASEDSRCPSGGGEKRCAAAIQAVVEKRG